MMVLGIDPGLTLGWAVLGHSCERLASGVMVTPPRRKRDHPGQRWLDVAASCSEVLQVLAVHPTEQGGSAVVAYEHVRRHQGTQAAHVYGGIVAHLLMEAAISELAVMPIEVGHVKQMATGSGNANKDAMVHAARERWPCLPVEVTADEADALWVAATAWEVANVRG